MPPESTSTLPSFWQRLRHGFQVVHADADFVAIAGQDWAERIMSASATDRHHAKQGRSIGRWILTKHGQRLGVYLKRHFVLPRVRGFLATLLPRQAWSPGLEERENLNWVREQGIPAPRAVAAGQFLGPWGRLQGFIAVEELDGMLALHEAVPLAFERMEPEAFDAWKRGLTAELARLAHAFHSRSAYHKDLYFCHFYIPESFTFTGPECWRNQVHVIDLHRLGKHRLLRFWWQAKDLAQLLYSSEVPGVTARDRVRFWKIYRDLTKGTPTWIHSLIRWKWQLYRRHHYRRLARQASRRIAA